MPIPSELRRQFYSRQSGWPETRARILDRAKGCCELCGKPNRTVVYTYTQPGREPAMAWVRLGGRRWRDQNGKRCDGWPGRGLPRKILVVLTVAHLNHVPGDDRDENLAALCAWCHLNFDKPQHKHTREFNKDRKRPLLNVQNSTDGTPLPITPLEEVNDANPR